ncbi:MAG: histidine kinase, partial [Bacteroidota bacterium]
MKFQKSIVKRIKITGCILICMYLPSVFAQTVQPHANNFSNISFQHLTTINGLSYSGVKDICTDRSGNLWIATGNGLNMFNGKTVDKYFAAEYPQLQNSNVIHVTCDSSNCIWVLTAGGNVTMLDEKRQMHRIAIYKNKLFVKTRWILNSQQGGIILLTSEGFYWYSRKTQLSTSDSATEKNFSYIAVSGFDSLQKKGYRQIFYYDDDNYLFVGDDEFFKVNFRTRQLEKKYRFPQLTALVKWRQNELLAYNRTTKEVESIHLESGRVDHPFKNLKDQAGDPVTAQFLFAARISEDEYIFATYTSGIYIYNRHTNAMYNYKHQVADPTSLGNNTQYSFAVGKKNWVFIVTNPNGISYFNRNDFIGTQTVFTDGSGNGYDSFVAGISTSDNNTYYIGTSEGLLEWKRNANKTTFINFPGENGKPLLNKELVFSILTDKNGLIWFTTNSQGIMVMDKNLKLVRHIKNEGRGKFNVKLARSRILIAGPDGFIWAGGGNGVCKINPRTFEVDNFMNSPLIRLDSFYCNSMFFQDNENLWIGTGLSGAFHYNLVTKELKSINTRNGLTSNEIFCVNKDNAGNIYIGTLDGLNILFPDGRIKVITHKDGLLMDRVEALLPDGKNRMWIGNDIGVACYNLTDSTITTFDERYGLSIYGFRLGSYFQTPNGEFIFGTPKGVQYFHPESLFNKKITLNALINKIETNNIASNITGTTTFELSSSDNQVTFYFGCVDFSPHLRTYYEYQLEGVDKDWIKIADQNSVRYNALPPGKYTFKVRISNNNTNWQNADNEITIIIATPYYKSWWFRLLVALLILVLVASVINLIRKRQIQKLKAEQDKKRASLELWENKQKATESRLQSLRLQMNPHFLFNALNSIQQMILANEEMVATRYLSRFSKLLRTVLIHSDKESISLKEEIEIIKMYVELESVRFKDAFSYTIECDEEIETEELRIPTLLIQPFVENAIWHGLMHKEGN